MIVNPAECKLASVVFVCVHCAPHVVYVFRFFIHFLSFSFSLIALGSCERTFKRARREAKGAVEIFSRILDFFDCFLWKKGETKLSLGKRGQTMKLFFCLLLIGS